MRGLKVLASAIIAVSGLTFVGCDSMHDHDSSSPAMNDSTAHTEGNSQTGQGRSGTNGTRGSAADMNGNMSSNGNNMSGNPAGSNANGMNSPSGSNMSGSNGSTGGSGSK